MKTQNKRLMIFGIIIALLIGILLVFTYSINKDINQQKENSQTIGETKEFNMVARNWEFQPNVIEVNQGDKVILNIESEDITHGIYIQDYNINKRIEPGETTTVEFVADKEGTFTFGCSVPCGMGHRNMVGQLIVN